LIDGRAGAGKSLFAQQLSDAYFKIDNQAARVVAMDDLYPGWEGLASGSAYLYSNILKPLTQGKTSTWQVWNCAIAESLMVTLPPGLPRRMNFMKEKSLVSWLS